MTRHHWPRRPGLARVNEPLLVHPRRSAEDGADVLAAPLAAGGLGRVRTVGELLLGVELGLVEQLDAHLIEGHQQGSELLGIGVVGELLVHLPVGQIPTSLANGDYRPYRFIIRFGGHSHFP